MYRMSLESSHATAAASPSANLVDVVQDDRAVPFAKSSRATPPLFAVIETWNIPAHIAIPIG